MSLTDLQAQGYLRPHKTSRREVGDLLRVARRDLADAAIPGLSADRRFLIAYDCALALATVPLACAGYQTHGQGHHWATFQALPLVLGEDLADLSAYLEICRTKRHIGTYDRGGEIADSEAKQLISEATALMGKLEAWLRANHPGLIGS